MSIAARFSNRIVLVAALNVLGFAAIAQAAVITNPTAISGNVLWLDAADAATITQTGGAVSQWADKSPGGVGTVTAAGATQPQTGANTLGGKNVLSFDGANQYLSGSAVLAGNDDNYTYFAVWKPNVNSGVQVVYEQAGAGGSARASILAANNAYGFNGEGNDAHNLVGFSPNLPRYTAMRVDNGLTINGANNIFINDNSANYTGTTGNPAALNVGTLGTRVGAKVTNNAERFNGDIAEVLVYDRLLSNTETTDVVHYLNAKWAAPEPSTLAHQWTFNDGTARDLVGTAHGTLHSGASIVNDGINGKLLLDGENDYMRTAPIDNTITNKTLVAWVEPANLTQRSGSVLSLEDPSGGNPFDGIVYGERTANQWMNGSNGFSRSNGTDNGGALESSTGEIMLAISYGPGGAISIYRNGELYASYTTGGPFSYAGGVSDVLLGLRHIAAAGQTGSAGGNDAYWAGLISEARIYNTNLSEAEIYYLFNQGPALVPEPGSLALSALSALALVAGYRRKRKQLRSEE